MTDTQLSTVEYTLTLNDAPAASWQLQAFICDEQINGSSHTSLDLACEQLSGDVDDLLGAHCELIMQREGGGPQFIYGIVTSVDVLGHAEHHLMLRVHLTSAFDLAEYGRHSRIWQDTSALDIITEVLDELFADYGRTYKLDHVSRGRQPRTYCVQYRETDHDFVCRLMEEEGINYYFHHDGDAGHEVMVLSDANSQYPDAINVDGTTEFPLIANTADLTYPESVQNLDWTLCTTTTSVLRRDYDWQAPAELFTSSLQGQADARGRTRRIYLHSERRFVRDDLDERASDLAKALALAGHTTQVSTNALGLRVGHRFTTDAHIDDGAPGEYIITAIRHQGSGTVSAAISDGQDYSTTLECVPAVQEIRPLPRCPKPRTHGPQTATVVGPGEIHTDEWGRVQVQFHWEEAPSNAEGASCWIRCAQSWASGAWGAQFIPRVGMEVLVEFLEGNPDRPVVTSCMYNGSHEPPFALPANATQSGWRTNSSPGGGGSNELRFEDAAGAEEIYIHGQKDWNVSIENNTSISTGVDETHNIGNDRSETVGNNHTESIGVDKTISVGSNHSESIGAAMTLSVGSDQTISIGANQTISVATNLDETVGASASQNVAATKTTTVGGMMAISVGGLLNTAVGGASMEEVGGLKSVSVGAASTLSVIGAHSVSAASISEAAGKSLALSAGTDLAASGGSKVALSSGGPLSASAKTKFTLDAGSEFTVTCGSATLSMKSNGNIVLKGQKITIDASGDLLLNGQKVKHN